MKLIRCIKLFIIVEANRKICIEIFRVAWWCKLIASYTRRARSEYFIISLLVNKDHLNLNLIKFTDRDWSSKERMGVEPTKAVERGRRAQSGGGRGRHDVYVHKNRGT